MEVARQGTAAEEERAAFLMPTDTKLRQSLLLKSPADPCTSAILRLKAGIKLFNHIATSDAIKRSNPAAWESLQHNNKQLVDHIQVRLIIV